MALPEPRPLPQSGASLSDLLTAVKNIVLALATLTQDYLNVQGQVNAPNLTSPTIVKATAGRIAVVSVITAGTSTGKIYDSATLAASTKILGIIPTAVGVYPVNLPASFGILVVPGTGQAVTVSYS